MGENYKTSQTEWSLPEGKGGAGAPAVQYGTDSPSMGGVTQPVKGEIKKIDAMQTSQQKNGGHATPES